MDLVSFLGQNFQRFWEYTGFANATPEHFVMLAVGLLFIWLAIKKNFEPLLLVPQSQQQLGSDPADVRSGAVGEPAHYGEKPAVQDPHSANISKENGRVSRGSGALGYWRREKRLSRRCGTATC